MLKEALDEKENYINKLENEIADMRKEIDSQRGGDLHEMNTIADTSRGAQTALMTVGGGYSVSQPNPHTASYYYQSVGPQYNQQYGEAPVQETYQSQFAPLRSSSGERT